MPKQMGSGRCGSRPDEREVPSEAGRGTTDPARDRRPEPLRRGCRNGSTVPTPIWRRVSMRPGGLPGWCSTRDIRVCWINPTRKVPFHPPRSGHCTPSVLTALTGARKKKQGRPTGTALAHGRPASVLRDVAAQVRQPSGPPDRQAGARPRQGCVEALPESRQPGPPRLPRHPPVPGADPPAAPRPGCTGRAAHPMPVRGPPSGRPAVASRPRATRPIAQQSGEAVPCTLARGPAFFCEASDYPP